MRSGRKRNARIHILFYTATGLMSDTTHKSWIYTLNNYTVEDVKRFKDFEFTYQVIGYEVGDSGTPHLQGFITWKRSYRLSQLKKLVPRAHWEPAVATDAANYCMKENYEVIDNRKQGKRTDLMDAISLLQEGGIVAVKEHAPEVYVKYHSGLEKLAIPSGKRMWIPEVTWLWGPTGVGKTQFVLRMETTSLWISNKTLQWWQGYKGQEAVLFDDFRRDFCEFHTLLRYLDSTPMEVEVKGGSVPLLAKRIYITCPYAPEVLYHGRVMEDIAQLLRRITTVVPMGMNQQVPSYIPLPKNTMTTNTTSMGSALNGKPPESPMIDLTMEEENLLLNDKDLFGLI